MIRKFCHEITYKMYINYQRGVRYKEIKGTEIGTKQFLDNWSTILTIKYNFQIILIKICKTQLNLFLLVICYY